MVQKSVLAKQLRGKLGCCLEFTNGEFKDRVDFMPSFLPKGKPEAPKVGVFKGLQ